MVQELMGTHHSVQGDQWQQIISSHEESMTVPDQSEGMLMLITMTTLATKKLSEKTRHAVPCPVPCAVYPCRLLCFLR